MSVAEVVVPIVLALLGGGGIWALFRIRPEAGMVSVQAAERVVIIQSTEITRLEQLVDECRVDVDQAKGDARQARTGVRRLEAEVRQLHEELVQTRRQRDALASENFRLRDQVAHLEARVRELERKQDPDS